MAFITLAGTLRDPTSELAVGDQIRFTHKSTTGETVEGAVSVLTIDPSGTYSKDLQYGLVLVEYKDVRTSQFKNLGVATVNGSNPATSIPELLNALVPVSSAELIEFQAILSDAVTARNEAEAFAASIDLINDLSQAYTFKTVALMKSSNIVFPVGKKLSWQGYYAESDGGSNWGVVASGAHTDDGGSVFTLNNGDYVKANLNNNKLNIKKMGAKGDGVADDTVAIQIAASYSVTSGTSLYFPSGIFMKGGLPVSVTLLEGQSFSVCGDGVGVSVFKEVLGTTSTIGRFNNMFLVTVGDGVIASEVSFSDMTIDHSGSGTTPSSPNSFEYEQAHCINVGVGTGSTLRNSVMTNVNTKDKIGGGIVFSTGYIEKATVTNCNGVDFFYTGGQRGDLEVQATIVDFTAIASNGNYTQLEPNISSPLNGAKPITKYSQCTYGTFDLIGFSGALKSQAFILSDCNNGDEGQFWLRSCKAQVTNSKLRVTSAVDWRNSISRFDSCEIVIGVDTSDNSFESLNISATTIADSKNRFSDCTFTADDIADAATTGFAVINSAVVAIADFDKYKATFVDCEFSDIFQYTADCYRNGHWEFIRTKLAGRSDGYALAVGTDSARKSRVLIDDCYLSGIQSKLFNVTGASGAFDLEFKGSMQYIGDFAGNRPESEWTDDVIDNAVWTNDSLPVGGGYRGMTVDVRKPVYGKPSSYTCSVGNDLAATWRAKNQAGVGKGSTANRPTLLSNDVGVQYLDTTLNADGKIINWNGAAWIDGTGTVV